MIDAQRLQASFPRAYAAVEPRLVMIRKAFSFAVIGAVNAVIDFGVFFMSYWYLTSTASVAHAFAAAADACRCGTAASLSLIAANVMAWLVAVTCSYVMNSYVTFAAESGRTLRWRAYTTFVVSGILGVTANTTTLVILARFIPVWAAKGCALLVSFVVNFSMSHFVVFRPKRTHSVG
jgi:putative flippase GtrA